MKRYFLISVVGLVVVVMGFSIVAATGIDNDRDAGEIENIAPGAISVTDQQARDLVLEAYPGTTVKEVDLDTLTDGSPVYDVGLDSGEEIMVSARTGKILGTEVDDGDDAGGDDDD